MSERDLWASVIEQAILDATSNPKIASDKVEHDRARTWLTSNSRNFRLVCFLAGIDADALRERIGKILDREENKKPKRKEIFHHVTFNGESLSVAEWAKRVGVSRGTMDLRLRTWSIERG